MPLIFLKQNVGQSRTLRRGKVVELSPTQIRRICHEVGNKYWYEGAPDLFIPSKDKQEPVVEPELQEPVVEETPPVPVVDVPVVQPEQSLVPEKPVRRKRRSKQLGGTK